MFLDYTNHFWPQLTTFDPLNWHFKIFCNFKGYKFANFKDVQRPSYKSYWPNFFLTMSKKVQFAKKKSKKEKKIHFLWTHGQKQQNGWGQKKSNITPFDFWSKLIYHKYRPNDDLCQFCHWNGAYGRFYGRFSILAVKMAEKLKFHQISVLKVLLA